MQITKQQHEDLIKGAVQTGSKSFGFEKYNDIDYVVTAKELKDNKLIDDDYYELCFEEDYQDEQFIVFSHKYKMDNKMINLIVVENQEIKQIWQYQEHN